jgi:thiol:disulfide interchange protein DsbC
MAECQRFGATLNFRRRAWSEAHPPAARTRMNRSITLAITAALGLSVAVACAQTAAPPAKAKAGAAAKAAPATGADAAIRNALAKAVPGVDIDSVRPSPIPGFKEVAIGGQVVYVSADGKYLVQGSLIELATRDNLTDASEAVLRRAVLATVPASRKIVFSPAKPKYHLTVFTDIDCGYCRKMHNQMAEYNKAGISVEYLFFPRAGINSESYNKAVSVWCAPDRRKALTDAKNDRPVPKKTCANPITADFELGRKVGVDGTPAIYAPDGTQLGGYLPPAEMLAKLDERAAKAVAAR